MERPIIKFLLFYKRFMSPLLGSLFGGACRFTPTCSDYSIEALKKYGLIKGLRMSLGRIFRCHPFARSGFDPIS